MRVKVRGVIVRDGRLVVSRERRRGIERLLIPGGRVRDGESITDALAREVREETGLDVVPKQLIYVAEVVAGHRVHDLNLIWLAELRDPNVAIPDEALAALDGGLASSIMPPVIDQIAADLADGWRHTPRWLGNVRRARPSSSP